MPTAYPYVVELSLTNERTDERKTWRGTLHAYTVADAVIQATFKASASEGSKPEWKVALIDVGPPRETYASDSVPDILAAMRRLAADKAKP